MTVEQILQKIQEMMKDLTYTNNPDELSVLQELEDFIKAGMEEQQEGPEVMTITEFWDAAQVGAYTDDDGVGYYGDATTHSLDSMYNIWNYENLAHETQVKIHAECTHIHWYNK